MSLDARASNWKINNMIERRADSEAVFQAIAHPVRRRLIERIARGDATVGQLAAGHPISLAAVSKHLQVLERAGLIVRRRVGREFHFEVRSSPLDEAQRILNGLRAHWTSALGRLAALAEEAPPAPAGDDANPRVAPKTPKTTKPAGTKTQAKRKASR